MTGRAWQGDRVEISTGAASVEVSIDRDGNGPRLRVDDVRSGAHAYFDPLVLACLVEQHASGGR